MRNQIKRPKLKYLVLFSFIFIFINGIPSVTRGAILYLIPSSQELYLGETFLVEVRVDSQEDEINTVLAELDFPNNLEIIDLSKGESILKLWPEEPSFSNKEGKIYFTGGIPGGFKGEGIIGKITFKANGIGQAIVNFKESSRVLLNDGEGTPASLIFLERNYLILEEPEGLPKISSSTHPDQNKWSKSNTLHLYWDPVEGTEYSYLLSHYPLAEANEIPDKPEGKLILVGDMEYSSLEDGIYYFNLKQKLPNENWSKKATFRVMIDATPPEEFELKIVPIEGKNYLAFATTDKTSGVDHYEISETKRESQTSWEIGEIPYLLKDQNLRSVILVKAVDKAGNERIAKIIPPYKISWKEILALASILIAIGLIVFWIIRKIKHQRL